MTRNIAEDELETVSGGVDATIHIDQDVDSAHAGTEERGDCKWDCPRPSGGGAGMQKEVLPEGDVPKDLG